jgi:hypothetical protein
VDILARFWSALEGPVHPEDAEFFDAHPSIASLFQRRFVPSAFFGDVAGARVILCFGNGGSEDDQEFYRSPMLRAEYLRHLRNPGPIAPDRFFTYFRGKTYTKWIAEGSAVLVNAVAYRSANMDALNESNTSEIPSVAIARAWVREKRQMARDGECLIVFHRRRLWGPISSSAGTGVIVSKNPASPYLSSDVNSAIGGFLEG